MLDLLKGLADYGVLGILSAVSLYYAWYKDRQYNALVQSVLSGNLELIKILSNESGEHDKANTGKPREAQSLGASESEEAKQLPTREIDV